LSALFSFQSPIKQHKVHDLLKQFKRLKKQAKRYAGKEDFDKCKMYRLTKESEPGIMINPQLILTKQPSNVN